MKPALLILLLGGVLVAIMALLRFGPQETASPEAPLPAPSPPAAWQRAMPVGNPVGCIAADEIRQTRVHDDQTIDFVMKDGRIMRNRLPQACPQLSFEERFNYPVAHGRLCSTDIVTVLVSPGVSRGASCGLGRFQQVDDSASQGKDG